MDLENELILNEAELKSERVDLEKNELILNEAALLTEWILRRMS